MNRLLREPLLHFFALGIALFALYGWLNRDGFDRPNEIVVARGQIDTLQTQFERVWQRAPTPQELEGLVENWVREEIFYREGLAAGLDRDDPIVRRRIGQKMEFIMEGAIQAPPTTEELRAWLDEHPASYSIEARYSLRQIYYDPARHDEHLQTKIDAAQRTLARGEGLVGDATLLPAKLDAVDASEVARTFGKDFATALNTLSIGRWQGPVRSGFGVHFVLLTAREDERRATLEEVREAVERDVLHARARQAKEAFYTRLREEYAVRIESSAPSDDSSG